MIHKGIDVQDVVRSSDSTPWTRGLVHCMGEDAPLLHFGCPSPNHFTSSFSDAPTAPTVFPSDIAVNLVAGA